MAGQLPCTRSPSACCVNSTTAGSVSAASSVQAGSRGAPGLARGHDDATGAEGEHQRRRPGRSARAAVRQETQRLGGCQSPTRPPCRAKLVQPCRAFHSTTGRNTASASIAPSQGAGRRSQGRIDGVTSSHSAMPNHSRAAVYLLAIARPANRPTASHQRESPLSQQACQRPEAGGPEHQQRRIRRHHHAADAEQQRRIEQHGGTQAGARGPAAGGRRHRPAAARRPRPPAGRAGGRPARRRRRRGAEADPQRDHRRMVRIARREGARPDPIIGLVRRKRHGRRDGKAQQRQRREQQCQRQTADVRRDSQ